MKKITDWELERVRHTLCQVVASHGALAVYTHAKGRQPLGSMMELESAIVTLRYYRKG